MRVSFPLRSIFVLVTVVAIGLGIWARSRHLRAKAAEHHFLAMDEGYAAGAIQRPVDLDWEWKFPSPVRMDQNTIEAALPAWRASIHHARVRDAYLEGAQRPWFPHLVDLSVRDKLMPPMASEKLQQWWQANIGSYANANPCLMEGAMGFPKGDPNLELTTKLLSEEQRKELAKRFFERRSRPKWAAPFKDDLRKALSSE